MSQTIVVQGRQLSEPDLSQIRQLIADHPQWSRRKISEVLALQWEWRNGAGLVKDMAARTMLLKLDQRGLIQLPPRRRTPVNRMRVGIATRLWDQTPIEGDLKGLGPLRVSEVSLDSTRRGWFAAALSQFHYLGYGGRVGENLQYVVQDEQERLLACALFGSAAWKCADRDHFIGWTPEQRQKHLHRVSNNTRFLILPWVKVPHLGSWILGSLMRCIGRDWQQKYGRQLALVETFVQRDRFKGTVYRAANWLKVGSTKGRTRQDRYCSIQAPIKDIYLYRLQKDYAEVLAS